MRARSVGLRAATTSSKLRGLLAIEVCFPHENPAALEREGLSGGLRTSLYGRNERGSHPTHLGGSVFRNEKATRELSRMAFRMNCRVLRFRSPSYVTNVIAP
jgi:hypothetical protein